MRLATAAISLTLVACAATRPPKLPHSDDPRVARILGEHCRETGSGLACFGLGLMYGTGHGGPLQEKQALSLFESACIGGVGAACGAFGAHEIRIGKVASGAKLLCHACVLGHAASCLFLARLQGRDAALGVGEKES